MRTVTLISVISAAIAIGGSHSALAQPPTASPPDASVIPEPPTIDGCQVVARIEGQVVLACELLWHVNPMLEANRDRILPGQYAEVREQLMKRQLASTLDTKLLYGEFRRNIPPENLPRIEENLLKPFEQQRIPQLIKQLNVNSRRELEQELARLGSSLDDARRAFNESVIAREWVRSKIKVDEEVSPDELLGYYQSHLAEFEFPTQARWEELVINKSRFRSPREAYAAMVQLGNEAQQRAMTIAEPSRPAFAEIAKAKSDGYNASAGGLYDWTTQGALKAGQIDAALFTLPLGRMSRIIKSEQGFHIVRVLERKLAGRKPFTDVQNDIRDELRDGRFRDAVDEYLTELRSNARIWTVYTGSVSADVLLGLAPGDTTRR